MHRMLRASTQLLVVAMAPQEWGIGLRLGTAGRWRVGQIRVKVYFTWFIPCILNSSFVDYQYKQQNILIMLKQSSEGTPDTPLSHSLTLKDAVLARIQQSDHKKAASILNSRSYPTEDLDKYLKELQLLQNIRNHEEQNYPGYIGYQNWKQLHQQLWGSRVLSASQKTWKILRLVNSGEVRIPTGLAFDFLKAITIQASASEAKQALSRFLKRNHIQNGLNVFRDLKNYPQFQQIIKEYSSKQTNNSSECTKKQEGGYEYSSRLLSGMKEKQHRLWQLRYDSMTQEMKECTFSPQINAYSSKQTPNRVRPKPCQLRQVPIDNILIEDFKASPVDFKIYEKSMKDIPGAKAHIKKQLLCVQEKQRLQRYLSKPFGSFK